MIDGDVGFDTWRKDVIDRGRLLLKNKMDCGLILIDGLAEMYE